MKNNNNNNELEQLKKKLRYYKGFHDKLKKEFERILDTDDRHVDPNSMRAIREMTDFDQIEFSKLLGCSRSFVHEIEIDRQSEQYKKEAALRAQRKKARMKEAIKNGETPKVLPAAKPRPITKVSRSFELYYILAAMFNKKKHIQAESKEAA